MNTEPPDRLITILARLGQVVDAQRENAAALEEIRAGVEAIDGGLSKIESAMAWSEKRRAEREKGLINGRC